MTSLLILGFIIGMKHALEADHVAAVAALTTNSSSVKHAVKQGAVWGLGHTITLFVFGSVVIWMDTVVPENLASTLELIVGVMLVILGLDVLNRAVKDKIHYHFHNHGEQQHFHAHSHENDTCHKQSTHEHEHVEKFPFKSLFVGLIHGMAGSAALILLTIETIKSPWQGMLYMALFGIGSIAGMAVLSIIIAIPLRSSAKGLTWFHNGLQIIVGTLTIGIGGATVYSIAFA